MIFRGLFFEHNAEIGQKDHLWMATREYLEIMFEEHAEVKMPHTDAAGLLFFANHFKFAHSTYETFMKSINCGLGQIIQDSDFLLLIVHAEADYKSGLCLGDEFDIFLKSEVGDSSFILSYSFKDSHGNISAEIKTVHVSVDKETKKKIPLPEKLRKGLLTIS